MNEILIAKSSPISIQRPMAEQYNLIHMRFDPTQNSPPSLWKIRLNKRNGLGNAVGLGTRPIKYDHKNL